jgi:hypothetical protein
MTVVYSVCGCKTYMCWITHVPQLSVQISPHHYTIIPDNEEYV